MTTMPMYKITLVVESEDDAASDPQIVKVVEAKDKNEAMAKARDLFGVENPEHNVAKIWAWCIERSRPDKIWSEVACARRTTSSRKLHHGCAAHATAATTPPSPRR